MKIALIGSAPSSVRIAPYGSKEWTIWGCSPGVYGVAPKTDMWFELHRWEPGQTWFSPEYVAFLKKYPGPVIMSEQIGEVENCTLLPVKELVDKYSPYFFTSSLAWMFAMAIDLIEEDWRIADREGKERAKSAIGLWGVDMSATEEYGYQRAGCQFFALLAKAKGIEVGVPPESDVLRPPALYGVCETSHPWIKMTARRRELDGRIADANQKLAQATQEIQFLSGCKDDMDWQQNTWFGNIDSLGRVYLEPPEVPALLDIVKPNLLEEDNVKQLYELAVG